MITISKKEYIELRMAQLELQCLQNAGVDNWDGCDYAFEDVDMDEEETKLEKEMEGK